ncbi:MAG: hypothetical protein JWN76_1863 [Chitinophagaceae bacterium]|nr:hypothetical protein [Chitinophagaceae bacterium]
MINLVIAYDDNDGLLGDYFESSHLSVSGNVQPPGRFRIISIRGLDCTRPDLDAAIKTLNGEPLIFAAFCHGDPDGTVLHTDNGVFVSVHNSHLFNGSFFYTTACNSAVELGRSLIDSGCSCFIGCGKDSLASDVNFHDVYIRCENYALERFLIGNVNVGVAFNDMMDYFTGEIDRLNNLNEVFAAVELLHNREAMEITGNTNLILTDLEV